ncbi:MAG: phage holin family protein [Acidimicrobiia bacterium]|nr:phage holin family protein [Acidimicrobiia bacterium]
MQRILIRVGINAMALFVAAGLVGGITLEEGFWKLVLVAAIFGIINAVLKPILVFLSIPFIVVTFGIALIVINALMLVITDALTAALEIDGFGPALLGAVIISVLSWTANRILPDSKKRASSSRS